MRDLDPAETARYRGKSDAKQDLAQERARLEGLQARLYADWSLVARRCPDYRTQKRWLQLNGATLVL